jgi:hypothetical protein
MLIALFSVIRAGFTFNLAQLADLVSLKRKCSDFSHVHDSLVKNYKRFSIYQRQGSQYKRPDNNSRKQFTKDYRGSLI